MPKSNVFCGIAGYVGRPDATGAVGVFRRPAGSTEWQHVLKEHETFAVFVHPKDSSLVFAGTSDGVYRSTDGGASFKRANFPDSIQVWSFIAADTNPDLMYAGASPINVYKSTDRGASWTRLPTPSIPERCSGPFAPRVMRMVQRPGNPNEIYAALEIAGAMRTTDGGQTWEDLGDHLVKLAETVPHLASKIVQQETPAEGMLDGHAITVSPENPDSPILAVRMGLFTTKDHGKTWIDMDARGFSPTTYGRDVHVSPQNPKTLYAALSVAAASHDGGVYRSDDAGKTWSRFDKVQVHGTIMSIGLNAKDPDQVYIGARYKGEIFGTEDGGKTWQEMSIPVEVKDVYSVACS